MARLLTVHPYKCGRCHTACTSAAKTCATVRPGLA
ncbi:six-cysteine peptide SCIFF [Pseudomonas sp. CrR25]|nr:six-cysteine peptide SCIFF [Pseudomonas sp. CrR25]